MCADKEHARAITKRVISYAKAEGMDFVVLAAAAGMNACEIDSLVEGDRALAAEEYVIICELLGVSYSTFMEDPRAAS